jgi:type VI secretion system protein ImpG
LGKQAYWHLMSHLTLNYLSLEDSHEGCSALQEILRLYEASYAGDRNRSPAVNQRLVDGITSVSSRRVVGRLDATVPAGFCRGVEVTLELDPQKFVGTGTFLFASVMEHFLGLFTSINSFSQLVLRMEGSEEIVKKWPPRAGEMRLL